MKNIFYLEGLFRFLKKSDKGDITLTYSRIEEIIGQNLSYAEKTDDRFWKQPRIKKLANKYNVSFGFVDTLNGVIHFIVN